MPIESSAKAKDELKKLETPAACRIRIDNKDTQHTISQIILEQFIDAHHVLRIRVKQVGMSQAQKEFDDPGKFTGFLGKSIYLNITPQGGVVDKSKELEFVGVITQVSLDSSIDGLNTVLITAHSPTIQMDGARKNAFYYNMTASDIISSVLGKHSVSSGGITSTPGTMEFMVQYGETDYAFIRRLASSNGLFSFYDGKDFKAVKSSGGGEELVWRESLGGFSLGLGTAQFEHAGQSFNYVQKKVIDEDSSNSQSKVAYSQLSKTSPNASANIYKGSSTTPLQMPMHDNKSLGQSMEVARNSGLGRMIEASGESIVPTLRIGKCAKIKGMGQLDGEYWIKRIRHIFDESGKYHNEFGATPLDLAFPDEVKVLPPVSHVQSAIVTDNNDPEGIGRVKVKLAWSSDQDTAWARIAFPDAGKDRGWYSIPEVGDEVLVCFEAGDPRSPIVLGSLYNGIDKPPLAAGSHLDNDAVATKLFKTKNGNEITFTDKDGDEKIVVTQKDGDNTITLSLNPKCITIESKGDITIKGDKVMIEGSSVDLKASGNASFKADGNLKVEASGNLDAKGSANCNLEGGATTVVKGSIVKIN
jgi:type VI secretion system secreted protein VgrG